MSKKTIFILFTGIIFIGLMVYGSFQYNQKLKTISEQAHKKTEQRAQKSKKENRNFYTKLANEKKIHFMVVGNGSPFGDSLAGGETLQQQLSDHIEKKYNNKVYQHQVVKNGADVFDGLFMYEKEKKETKQDLVVIAFGQYDVDRLTVEQFEKNYETLLNRVITDQPGAEIFTFIANELGEGEEYASVIAEVSDHYGVPTINGEEVFNNADESIAELMTEEGYPNEAGIRLYAEAFFNTINEKVSKNTLIDYAKIEPLYNLNHHDAFSYIDTPEESDGFELVGEHYASSTTNNSIRYEFTGNLLALNLNNAGGVMEVYLDGEYYKQYDLNSLPEGEIHLLITDELEQGEHTVQVFVRESGKTIQLKSLIIK